MSEEQKPQLLVTAAQIKAAVESLGINSDRIISVHMDVGRITIERRVDLPGGTYPAGKEALVSVETHPVVRPAAKVWDKELLDETVRGAQAWMPDHDHTAYLRGLKLDDPASSLNARDTMPRNVHGSLFRP